MSHHPSQTGSVPHHVAPLVPAVLRAAADDIETVGWAQGEAVDLTVELAAVGLIGGPVCAGVAIGREVVRLAGEYDYCVELSFAARDALLRHVGTRGSVVRWNDAPGRTAAEVIAALRGAADAVATSGTS